MINTIKSLFERRKEILLSVPNIFPRWHSSYGEETFFAKKIAREKAHKIHALKSNVEFWRKSCLKFATGNYIAKVVYLEDTPKGKVYYSIRDCEYLHMQVARFDMQADCVLVEDIPVDIETVARNEGLDTDDFMEWRDKLQDRVFAIVHFTEFKYE